MKARPTTTNKARLGEVTKTILPGARVIHTHLGDNKRQLVVTFNRELTSEDILTLNKIFL